MILRYSRASALASRRAVDYQRGVVPYNFCSFDVSEYSTLAYSVRLL